VLIALGAVGFVVALLLNTALNQTLTALTGGEGRPVFTPAGSGRMGWG
jgi:hypothetical protein